MSIPSSTLSFLCPLGKEVERDGAPCFYEGGEMGWVGEGELQEEGRARVIM